MRRLSLTAIPSRRQKLRQRASLRSTCSKTTSSMRSTFGNLSMLSSLSTSVSSDSLSTLSTATSSYGGLMEDYDDLDEEIEDEEIEEEDKECSEKGWMYWKKSDDSWLKMYARLRNELLWLSKGARDTVAVVQIAVAGVRATDIGGFIARGPAGESMELFAYERRRTGEWIDALYVAARRTQSYERSVAAESATTESTRETKEVKKVYSGTLVTYNKEQTKSTLKRRFRDACRRRLEKLVDRLDTSKR